MVLTQGSIKLPFLFDKKFCKCYNRNMREHAKRG